MAVDIIMPQLGESIHEGTIGTWLKKPGDPIERFEPVVEILTDKVNSEIPAPEDGTLSEILVQEGETVAVGTVIARMEMVVASSRLETRSTRSNNNEISSMHEQVASRVEHKPVVTAATRKEAESTGVFPSGNSGGGWFIEDEEDDWTAPATTVTEKRQPHRYSPAVRRLAEEHHLDLAALNLQGSGIGGRITRDDILQHLAEVSTRDGQESGVREGTSYELRVTNQNASSIVNRQSSVTQSAQPTGTSQQAVEVTYPATSADRIPHPSDVTPLTPMRKAIAEHMTRSKQTTPHAWTIVEVDMTELVKYRAQIKDEFKQKEGIDLTYLPFVIKAVVEALGQFPHMNASFVPESNGISVKKDLNIGIAIDVPDGLVVPVIAKADEKNLVGLVRSMADLITRARSKKLTHADLQGGTFTVNNPGAFGSVLSYPIINQPQAGIITMEAIIKRPVVIDDMIAIRSIMNMCLSFDHRVVDGAYAGRFLQAVKAHLQNPTSFKL
jgi:2-oxoisovalerate dehydrogenase E2 component (dihydrolipoyl transacylase)